MQAGIRGCQGMHLLGIRYYKSFRDDKVSGQGRLYANTRPLYNRPLGTCRFQDPRAVLKPTPENIEG